MRGPFCWSADAPPIAMSGATSVNVPPPANPKPLIEPTLKSTVARATSGTSADTTDSSMSA